MSNGPGSTGLLPLTLFIFWTAQLRSPFPLGLPCSSSPTTGKSTTSSALRRLQMSSSPPQFPHAPGHALLLRSAPLRCCSPAWTRKGREGRPARRRNANTTGDKSAIRPHTTKLSPSGGARQSPRGGSCCSRWIIPLFYCRTRLTCNTRRHSCLLSLSLRIHSDFVALTYVKLVVPSDSIHVAYIYLPLCLLRPASYTRTT